MSEHDFQELVAPRQAAEQLKISVATLRKYSLIVEKVTGNRNYYERTKQKARLYSAKDIEDLKKFRTLSKEDSLTLQDAAQRIFTISNEEDATKVEKQDDNVVDPTKVDKTMVDAKQVVKLLNMLQQTIATQNQAISDLQAQVARVEKQNKELIDTSKQLAAPKEVDGSDQENKSEESNEQKSTSHKVHEEILKKARENQEKRANQNLHRTLADMQVPKKKHWWNHIFG